MATSKKLNETGWFYHAPSKRPEDSPMVSAPPPSQIPGLSHGLPDTAAEDNQPKMWIKDTDSAYIRLAKQGGRADLLRYRSPKPQSEAPRGYPRCDWYYHDDVLATENQQSPAGEHQFMLPDYMVHNEWPGHKQTATPSAGDSRNKRAPFSYDQESVYSRESNPTDKTVKLPELKPSGYGVRTEKNQGRHMKQAPIERREPIIPQGELTTSKYKPVPRIEPEGVTVMGRLLSHGYNDRDQQRSATKQQKVEDQFEAGNRLHAERMHSGAQEKAQTPTHNMAAAGMASKRGEEGKQHKSSGKGNKSSEKELFKLSKFKKVSARTNSHRSQMHGHNPIVHDLDTEPHMSRLAQPVM